jgi:hypothetical protein
MDEIMKTIIVTIFLSLSFIGFSQTWQTLHAEDYLESTYFMVGHQHSKRAFKINHADSSIWMGYADYLFHFDSDGNFHRYGELDHPEFDYYTDFRSITFTSDKTYICSDSDGLFEFDGNTFTNIFPVDNGLFLSSDVDTVWMGRTGGSFQIIYPAFITYDPYGSYSTVVESKNGELWLGAGGTAVKVLIDSTYQIITADSTDYFLGGTIHDLSFSPNDNRFYVASDSGMSVALNKVFVDTITTYNTIGMPTLPVVEIEFDSQDNIWVSFGANMGASYPTKSFGYLDRSTNEWTIYDSSNTPMNYSIPTSKAIEVDPCDNLWVVDRSYLHVLSVGSCGLGWLGNTELTNTIVEIYPNPTSDQVVITSEQLITKILLYDGSGRQLQQIVLSAFQTKVDLSNISPGTYIVKIFTGDGAVTKKIMKL